MMEDEVRIQVGDIVVLNGRQMRYLGNGWYEPVGEPMEKRFGTDDCGPLVSPCS
mgnify:CR=1 FL=1